MAVFRACTAAILRLPPVAIRLTWVPREQNEAADQRSRNVSLADARLTDRVYSRVIAWAGFTPSTDLFATATNTRTSRFYSRLPSSDAAGVDGLRAPPQPDTYGYPPFSLAPPFLSVVEHLQEGGFRFLAIIPWDLGRTRLSADRYRFLVFPALEAVLLPPPYTGPPVASPIQLCAVTSAYPPTPA